MSKGYRKLDPEIKDKMQALRDLGKSNGEIARELGVSHMTVYSRLGSIKKYKARAEVAKEELAEQSSCG